jgi:hypothetical protein
MIDGHRVMRGEEEQQTRLTLRERRPIRKREQQRFRLFEQF